MIKALSVRKSCTENKEELENQTGQVKWELETRLGTVEDKREGNLNFENVDSKFVEIEQEEKR